MSRLVKLMDKLHAEEQFSSLENRKEFIKNLTFEDLQNWLIRVNGMVRELPAAQRTLDGSGVVEVSNNFGYAAAEYVPPAKGDRQELLSEAFNAAHGLEPEKAATLLGLSINTIHPFMDGNGRTSRFVYTMLAHGYDGSQEDKQLLNDVLENGEGRKVVDLDPTRAKLSERWSQNRVAKVANEHGYQGKLPNYSYLGSAYEAGDVGTYCPDTLLVGEHVSADARAKLHAVLMEKDFNMPNLFAHCFEEDRKPEDFMRSFEDGRMIIENGKLIGQMTEEEIARLRMGQDEIKKEYVQGLVRVFANPENAELADSLVTFYRPQAGDDLPPSH